MAENAGRRYTSLLTLEVHVSKPKKKPVKKKDAKKTNWDNKPKFHFPPKGSRCEAVVIPLKKEDGKPNFHEASFRNMLIISKKTGIPKETILTVGCPKYAKGRGMKKAHRTEWRKGEEFVETKSQCRYTDGPKAGEKAGMRAHAKTEAAVNGKCRAEKGYKLLKPKPTKKKAPKNGKK